MKKTLFVWGLAFLSMGVFAQNQEDFFAKAEKAGLLGNDTGCDCPRILRDLYAKSSSLPEKVFWYDFARNQESPCRLKEGVSFGQSSRFIDSAAAAIENSLVFLKGLPIRLGTDKAVDSVVTVYIKLVRPAYLGGDTSSPWFRPSDRPRPADSSGTARLSVMGTRMMAVGLKGRSSRSLTDFEKYLVERAVRDRCALSLAQVDCEFSDESFRAAYEGIRTFGQNLLLLYGRRP